MTITLPPDLADLLHQAGGKWPEADEDGVRTVANAWRELSTKLDAIRQDGARLTSGIGAENSGQAIDAFASYWADLDGHLNTAITASAKTVEVVDGVAKATEGAKTGMIEVLRQGQEAIAKAENAQAVPVVGAVIGPAVGALLRWLLPILGRLLLQLLKLLWRFIVWLAKQIARFFVWLWKKIVELFKKLFKKDKPTPPGVKPGWKARPADNGKGTVYQKPGSVGNANSMRVMEPTSKYPNGYVRFYNEHGQPIGLNGKPGPNSETHIPIRPDGTYPLPKGW